MGMYRYCCQELFVNPLQSRGKVVEMEKARKDIERLLPAIQRQEFQAMQKEGIRGEKQYLIETHAERINAVVCLGTLGPLTALTLKVR
jgi:hypothetical protein